MNGYDLCSKPICGNGILENTEECDDKNLKSNDGCSNSCKIESGYYCPNPAGNKCLKRGACGNGIIEPDFGE